MVLLGLGIGSSVGAALARSPPRPRVALAWCQMLLALAIVWASYILTQSLPYWPIDPSMSRSPWYTFQLDFLRSLWAMFPGALLWDVGSGSGSVAIEWMRAARYARAVQLLLDD